MGESEENRAWQKRVAWAKCAEPHKTVLDTLASHWIDGDLSDGDLALELLKMQVSLRERELEGVVQSNPPPRKLHVVHNQWQILATALVDVYEEWPGEFDADFRRLSLRTCIEQDRSDPGSHRAR